MVAAAVMMVVAAVWMNSNFDRLFPTDTNTKIIAHRGGGEEGAENTAKTIRENGMETECVVISLKYDLIDYIEKQYPDIQTGFLLFASFGATDRLNCDYLGMEEESVSENAVSGAHDQNKKLLVWTPNDKESQKHFICSSADGLITDKVVQAVKIKKELKERNDFQRIVDRILTIVS